MYQFLLFFSEQRTTQQGQVYFLHTRTGVSTWHDPRVPRSVRSRAQILISYIKSQTTV